MMREAESHADEDKKRREEIEARNHADQAVYAAERMLRENGDKLAAADKQAIETAIADLKKAIESERRGRDEPRRWSALNAGAAQGRRSDVPAGAGGRAARRRQPLRAASRPARAPRRSATATSSTRKSWKRRRNRRQRLGGSGLSVDPQAPAPGPKTRGTRSH